MKNLTLHADRVQERPELLLGGDLSCSLKIIIIVFIIDYYYYYQLSLIVIMLLGDDLAEKEEQLP